MTLRYHLPPFLAAVAHHTVSTPNTKTKLSVYPSVARNTLRSSARLWPQFLYGRPGPDCSPTAIVSNITRRLVAHRASAVRPLQRRDAACEWSPRRSRIVPCTPDIYGLTYYHKRCARFISQNSRLTHIKQYVHRIYHGKLALYVLSLLYLCCSRILRTRPSPSIMCSYCHVLCGVIDITTTLDGIR